MKKCIVILCVIATRAFAQESINDGYLNLFLRFQDGQPSLLTDEENVLLDHVYDLFLSESVVIQIRREGNSFAHDDLASLRFNYFTEMCREYNFSDQTTSIRLVNTRFEEDAQAHVKITYRDPIIQKKIARREELMTHPDGWRAQCFQSDIEFLKATRVQILRTPEDFNQLNLLTVDESGERLEILAVVSIALERDTLFYSPVKFQVPLHGISELGCMEYTWMKNERFSFPSNGGKASVKREDGLMLWKINIQRSGVYVLARKVPESQTLRFVAPEGYAIISGHATSSNPYMSVEASIAGNQLAASFNDMPELEHVSCEFTLVDMQGNLCSIAAVPARLLLSDNFLSFLRKGDPVLPENLVAQKVINN
jgi:hypothetical protein